MNTVIIPESLCHYLEGLHYEEHARKDLLAFLVQKELTSTPWFQRYYQEYVEFSTQYELAKKELENKYLPKNKKKISWSLDFDTCEVSYNEE